MKLFAKYSKWYMLSLVIIIGCGCYSQEKDKKVRAYYMKVELMDGSTERGYLYEIDNNSVTVISTLSLKKKSKTKVINVEDIGKIYIRRKGKVMKSALIGFLGTAVVIEAISVSSNPHGSYISNEAAAVGIGFIFGFPIGAIVGSGSKKIEVYGNAEVFKEQGLEKYALNNRIE